MDLRELPPPPPEAGRADVLVIDDDAMVRDLLQVALTRQGHAVREATTGEDGLAAVASSPPDLILCDLNMPGMSGLEVCAHLKGSESTRHIPLVLITGLADNKVRLRGIELGADDYLSKPLDLAELFARTRSLLRTKRLDDEVRRQRAVLDSLLSISTFNPAYGDDLDRLRTDFLQRAAELLQAREVAVVSAASLHANATLIACWPAEENCPAVAEHIEATDAVTQVLNTGERLLVRADDETQQRALGLREGFAGVPIRDLDGRVLGTVVAFGTPATLNAESLAVLEMLALRIGSEIQLRTQNERLEIEVVERTRSLREALHELERAKEALERAQEDTIFRLALAAEYRDRETANHLRRMARYSELLARAVGLPAEAVDLLRYASLMHDIGKIGIPDTILRKPGPLTPQEYELMKTHTLVGRQMCEGSDAPLLQMSERVALGHHEHWDGKGYPHGRAGEEIPIEARIVAVADVFDALSSERRYKRAWTLDEAFAHLQSVAGSHLDPHLVALFMHQRLEVERIADALRDTESAEAGRIPHALR